MAFQLRATLLMPPLGASAPALWITRPDQTPTGAVSGVELNLAPLTGDTWVAENDYRYATVWFTGRDGAVQMPVSPDVWRLVIADLTSQYHLNCLWSMAQSVKIA